jgi:hypothetical protein
MGRGERRINAERGTTPSWGEGPVLGLLACAPAGQLALRRRPYLPIQAHPRVGSRLGETNEIAGRSFLERRVNSRQPAAERRLRGEGSDA